MADKPALIKRLFELCNGPRNYRIWILQRSVEFAQSYGHTSAEQSALMSLFELLGEQCLDKWVDVVIKVYDLHVSEAELLLANTELEDFWERGNPEPDDSELSPDLSRVLSKLVALQTELDAYMHPFFQNLIKATCWTYTARN